MGHGRPRIPASQRDLKAVAWMVIRLLTRGRGSGRQFPKYAQKTSRGLLVRKRFQRHRGCEMGRLGTETDADQAVSARGN